MATGDGLNSLEYESPRRGLRWKRRDFVGAVLITALLITATIHEHIRDPVRRLPARSVLATAAPATTAAFVLLKTQAPVVQPFVSPSANEEKWDFGGGSKTALNWSNWKDATDPFQNQTGQK